MHGLSRWLPQNMSYIKCDRGGSLCAERRVHLLARVPTSDTHNPSVLALTDMRKNRCCQCFIAVMISRSLCKGGVATIILLYVFLKLQDWQARLNNPRSTWRVLLKCKKKYVWFGMNLKALFFFFDSPIKRFKCCIIWYVSSQAIQKPSGIGTELIDSILFWVLGYGSTSRLPLTTE